MTKYDFYLRQGKSQQGGEHIVFHILERMSRQFTNTAQQAGLIEAILDEHILRLSYSSPAVKSLGCIVDTPSGRYFAVSFHN